MDNSQPVRIKDARYQWRRERNSDDTGWEYYPADATTGADNQPYVHIYDGGQAYTAYLFWPDGHEQSCVHTSLEDAISEVEVFLDDAI